MIYKVMVQQQKPLSQIFEVGYLNHFLQLSSVKGHACCNVNKTISSFAALIQVCLEAYP